MSAQGQPPAKDRSEPQHREETALQGLGGKVRRAREERGVSTRKLAQELGVSPALIGHIETGRSLPSINTLFGLAVALEVPLDQLLDSGTEIDTVDRQTAVNITRQSDRQDVDIDSGIRWQPFTTASSAINFGLLHLDAGASTIHADEPAVGHRGHEYGYVVSGRLELTVDGETNLLHTGDSFEFDARQPHTLRNPGPHPLFLAWLEPNLRNRSRDASR